MNPRSPTTGAGYPSKRARHVSPAPIHAAIGPKSADGGGEPCTGGGEGAKSGQSSGFRNVSACNRCRLRKNRCDQQLPCCASCEKAGVKCVGYDPITKREIPRSYVFYLETRISYLETLLRDHKIPYAPASVLDHVSRPGADTAAARIPGSEDGPRHETSSTDLAPHQPSPKDTAWHRKHDESEKLDNLDLSNIGSVSVQGASDPRCLGSTSGISFARVVFAAVKSSVPSTNSDKSGVKPSQPHVAAKAVGSGTTSMRDSFFGLQTKPTINQAPFPSKDVGMRLVGWYFEHANPQIPILHRGEFMKMFELAYAAGDARVRTPRELYLLNIVFAIGAGIFLGDPGSRGRRGSEKCEQKMPGLDRQYQPEEYHASAIVHLESCLSSQSSVERTDGFGGGLEELQAVLLLAGFALLRPVAPGLWYIIGVAVRLAVDLGLHYEDGKDIDTGLEEMADKKDESEPARMQRERQMRERGRREWVRDFRRRLWWCTYSFDRLVSTCVGRPFGIADQVITTEFPSLLDDKYITPSGFLEAPLGEPSYKQAAYHYFRLRLLQSEILQVLQHQQAKQARAGGANQRNPYMHTALPSPFLSKYDGFRSWRIDIDKRLWEWKSSAPTRRETGVAFSVEFLELNYWQCVIMLYRQSLSVPPMFEGEFSTSKEVNSPSIHNVELREDEERVFLKVAEAGQRVLRLYRQLHRVHLVNYTFLATHHLFTAGISFLYAIWHSAIVRSRLTMDEVDFTILAATSVLGDLIEKCPPAEACRDAFDRISQATVQRCMSTTGFGPSAQCLHMRKRSHGAPPYAHSSHPHNSDPNHDYLSNSHNSYMRHGAARRPKPHFDMGLEHLVGSPPSSSSIGTPQSFSNSNNNHNVQRPSAPETKSGFEVSNGRPQNHRYPPPNRTPSGSSLASDLVISPPLSSSLDTSCLDPTFLPTPTSAEFSQPVQSGYPGNPYQEMPFASAPGMDFLDGGEGGTSWDGIGGGGDLGMGFGMGMGLDLDSGLGWEGVGHHDFSEGGNGGVDLFEGFFFGGAGSH